MVIANIKTNNNTKDILSFINAVKEFERRGLTKEEASGLVALLKIEKCTTLSSSEKERKNALMKKLKK